MVKIELRYQQLSDAKRFLEVLTNPNFTYFQVPIKTLEDEKEFIRKTKKLRKQNVMHSFTILHKGEVIGGIGIKIDQHRKHIGEIGYFLDEVYWGRGITTKAVKMVEKKAIKEFKIKRLTIIMDPRNKASERVAIKAGYKKEGLMRGAVEQKGKLKDALLYAKVV